MKTPEEMAEEYADSCVSDTYYTPLKAGFVAGYKAAQDQQEKEYWALVSKGKVAMQTLNDELVGISKVIIPKKNCEAALKAMQSAQDLNEQAIKWTKTLPPASERCNQCACEGYRAGYKAAQEHAHAALEEAEARIQELRDQLMEESGGRLKLFKDDADAKAAYQECLEEIDLDKAYHQGLKDGAPQWISVKDRLPDEEIDVLVCCEIRINGNLIKHQQVIRFIGGNWDTSLPGSITYWQVLPKLPGE
jgi:hypothetical protein